MAAAAAASALTLGALVGACSGARTEVASVSTPKVAGVTPAGDVSASDDRLLDEAVSLKRSGDPIAAWKTLERLPKGSSATLDGRYLEVLGAYSDARTREIGREIAAPHGGGPPPTEAPPASSVSATSATPAAPAGNLDVATLDKLVAAKTHALRDACYKGRSEPTSFLLVFRIDEDGTVADVATGNVTGEPDVASCVRARAKQWKFPASEHGAAYTRRVIFGPADTSH